jgi:nucleotide-binding universal stress UspA family protein
MGYDAPILVGLDESDAAAEALRWAAWQSSRTAAPVVAVHAYCPDPDLRDRPEGRKAEESLVRARATQWIRDALSESGAVPWRTHLVVVEGSPCQVLAERSDEAGMLVVGASVPTAALPRARAGSLSASLRTTSTCPVVSVPPPRPNRAEAPVARLPRGLARVPGTTART